MNPVKFLFALTSSAFVIFGISPQDSAQAELLSKLEHQVETVQKKDRTARSRSAVTLHPVPEKDGAFILNIEGEGQFAKFTNVRWTNSARIVERGQQVLVQHSSTKVFSGATLVFQAEKNYDYDKKLVAVEHTGEDGKIILNEQFPIKGPICDNVTLVHVIDKMLPPAGGPGPQHFYLLTDEPKLYHVMVKNRGTEVLRLPSGEFETTKIQLMADLGPLTDMAARMVPKTYVWLSKDIGWVQYEGMETGYQSPNIISFVTVNNKLE
jgi:hypothetical protein